MMDLGIVGILGVILVFSGVELAIASRDMGRKEESLVILDCAAVSLIGSSAALGFIAGVVLRLLLRQGSGLREQCNLQRGQRAVEHTHPPVPSLRTLVRYKV